MKYITIGLNIRVFLAYLTLCIWKHFLGTEKFFLMPSIQFLGMCYIWDYGNQNAGKYEKSKIFSSTYVNYLVERIHFDWF
mgnify:CR=1 FL=1